MPDMLVIKIPQKQKKSSVKKNKKLNVKDLIGFSEVKKEHICHLHGSWLKYLHKSSNIIHAGGFLDKIEDSLVYLRCPSKDNLKVNINDNVFFVKEINENYIALLNLINNHEQDIHSLVNYKKNIVKMINDGDIKFKK